MSEIKAWGSVAQQLDKMNVDVASMTAANVSQASGDVFFVGRPNQDGQTWSLKKITPEEMGKLIYNYLTSSSVAAQLAAVLGVSRIQEITIPANSYIDVTVSKNSFYKLWPGTEIASSLTFILTTDENNYESRKLVLFGTSWAINAAYKLSVVNSSTIRLTREQSTNYTVHLQQISW